ncbi:metal-dependent transcriptional regulator [[Eubacterium] cellulosolvens]
MRQKASPAVEEVLEQIHRLQESSGAARTKVLGKRLGVSLGTVTNTLSRLERLGFVRREPYKGTQLTSEGRKVALNVLRRHRLLERLLTDILRVRWSKAHDIACKLEHSVDDEVANAIEDALAHPKTCPHGNAIPPKTGSVPSQVSTRLTELSPHDAGTLVRVLDEEEEGALAHLDSIGLIPGAEFTVDDQVAFDGAVVLHLGKSKVTVSKRAASLVAVKKRGKARNSARRA